MGLRRSDLPPKPREEDTYTLIIALGMNPERDLRRDCADFYTLERIIDMPGAARMMAQLERSLSREFSAYLDLAVGGELRHALSVDSEHLELPHELDPYFRALRLTGAVRHRGWAWSVWTQLRQDGGERTIEWLDAARRLFNSEYWTKAGAGGPKWGQVARVEYDWLRGRLSRRVFLDRCFTIEHNNGAVFDKVFTSADKLKKVLQIQASNNYARLSKYASDEVRYLWDLKKKQSRQDYDSSWLGVQE